MHRFVIGFSLPFAVCAAWAGWAISRSGYEFIADVAALSLTLLAIPIVAALAAVSLIHTHHTRRWLVPNSPGRVGAGLLGFFAGGAAIPLIGVGLYFANRLWLGSQAVAWDRHWDIDPAPDALVVAAICFATAVIAAWMLPRQRAGMCAGCGYDVRFSLDSGRCPECGRAI